MLDSPSVFSACTAATNAHVSVGFVCSETPDDVILLASAVHERCWLSAADKAHYKSAFAASLLRISHSRDRLIQIPQAAAKTEKSGCEVSLLSIL